VEIGQFCHDEPQNFANWPAEYGKIYHGKLWALIIIQIVFGECIPWCGTAVEKELIKAVI